MGTNADKHARQREGRTARLEQARKEVARSARRRRLITAGAVVAVIAVVVGAVVLLTRDEGGDEGGDERAGDTSSTTTTTAAPEANRPEPEEGLTLTADTPCPPAEGSEQRVEAFAGPPPSCIDPAKGYTATFATNKGTFTATLDPQRAPVTVNNFVVLSRYHFYDGVPFHRIVPGFVIQAGDGDGAPWGNNDNLGYTIQDELPASTDEYVDFSLAMANAGPNTNGSQFFVVLPGGGAQLDPPNYSLFGQVTEGQDVVAAIGALGDEQQNPTEPVVIESVTITES